MRCIHTTMLGFFFCTSLAHLAAAAEIDVVNRPVPVVLQDRLNVQTAAGVGEVPIRVSRNWKVEQPDITRAVIIIHGWPRRDIDADQDLQQRAGAFAADTLFVTPQFLTAIDVEAHHLPAATLRWQESGWQRGYDAKSPAAISAFAVMDAIFARLA